MLNNQSLSQVNYNDALLNTQRMILLTDFILSSNLEEQYLQHLRGLQRNTEWQEFYPVIAESIQEYDISDEDIYQAIPALIKVPAYL
ncbi:hypothetical protein [Cytobacillus horneckiae]|uniref:Uncharacterized protein n=1 Tax=Cytobacillus horneckiae TaxID=549687 RepID=A0A2N0ZFA2_9BACI|nr:hypothetical protein [Cytobacillus horneckiae]MEC1155625.1 hypothetical protein [Cytobacillus horneckiae]MED2936944.1 hypothetical protein [Cytobacillus horneckiae]PKG28179.1 hypothetical protein CWS20_15155 [Cytobacillus horneckiae]